MPAAGVGVNLEVALVQFRGVSAEPAGEGE